MRPELVPAEMVWGALVKATWAAAAAVTVSCWVWVAVGLTLSVAVRVGVPAVVSLYTKLAVPLGQ